MLGAFGVPGDPLAPILAARGFPKPLPSGLLGSLGMPEAPQDSPGPRFWSPRTPILVKFEKNLDKFEVTIAF